MAAVTASTAAAPRKTLPAKLSTKRALASLIAPARVAAVVGCSASASSTMPTTPDRPASTAIDAAAGPGQVRRLMSALSGTLTSMVAPAGTSISLAQPMCPSFSTRSACGPGSTPSRRTGVDPMNASSR